jgi:hypothetical protein
VDRFRRARVFIGIAVAILSLPGLATEPVICKDATSRILQGVAKAREAAEGPTKHWPFAGATREGIFETSDFTAFVLQATGGTYPRQILLDPRALHPRQRLAQVEDAVPEILLERWAEANKDKFLLIAERYRTNVKHLVAAYFKQGEAHIDDFILELEANGHLIDQIVTELNKVPAKEHHMSVGTFIDIFLQNPLFLRPGYTLADIHRNLYPLQRASNNLKVRWDEFIRRLSRQKFNLDSFGQEFAKQRELAKQPKKLAVIKEGLLRKARSFGTQPLVALKTAPADFVHFASLAGKDAKAALEWIKTLDGARAQAIFRALNNDMRQRFVTNPQLVITFASLATLDAGIFLNEFYMKYGVINAPALLTLGSLVTAEIPVTFYSVKKMAAIAAQEFDGARTLSPSAFHNVGWTRNNAAAKTWDGLKTLSNEVWKDAPAVFVLSAMSALGSQGIATVFDLRKGETLSPMGYMIQVAAWFAIIGSFRYKFFIGRVQTPLSATTFFTEHPRANFAMIQGITAFNIYTGNLLWVHWWDPWIRNIFGAELPDDGKEKKKAALDSVGVPMAQAGESELLTPLLPEDLEEIEYVKKIDDFIEQQTIDHPQPPNMAEDVRRIPEEAAALGI